MWGHHEGNPQDDPQDRVCHTRIRRRADRLVYARALVLIRLIYLFMVWVFGWLMLAEWGILCLRMVT